MKPPRPGAGQDLGDRQRVEVPGAARVGHEVLQRQAVGQVGLLRGEEDPRAGGDPHAALAVGPEAGDRLEERALAAAARPADVKPVALAQDEPRHADERNGVVPAMAELEPLDRQHRAGDDLAPPEVAAAGLGVEAVAVAHPLDGGGERGQAGGVGPEHRDLGHHVGEPRGAGDQLGGELGARHVGAEAHVAGHERRKRRQVGEQALRQEVGDLGEHQHRRDPDVLPAPGAVDAGVEPGVGGALRELAARGGDQPDPVQHGGELAAPGAVAAAAARGCGAGRRGRPARRRGWRAGRRAPRGRRRGARCRSRPAPGRSGRRSPGRASDSRSRFAAAPARSSNSTGWLRLISATETNQIDATAPKKPITRPIRPP